MKTILFVKCEGCGKENFLNYTLSKTEIKDTCTCGNQFSYLLGSEITIGTRILERSKYEFKINEDYSLSIVFSAMSFECELSSMYVKWGNISKNKSDQELEEFLRKLGNIQDRIQELSKLMFSVSFEKFVQDNSDLYAQIKGGFKSLCVENLAESFQKKLFWPRNKVLHSGYSDYTSDDAKRCLNIAELGLRIFDKMDKHKSNQCRTLVSVSPSL